MNRKDRNSTLIDETQENLLSLDEYMSDTEPLYSIIFSRKAYEENQHSSFDEEDGHNLLTEASPDINSMTNFLGQFNQFILMNTEVPNLECNHE